MENKLTQKQETFCLKIFEGMSQHDAYLAAGYSNKQSSAVIDKNASILAQNSKVLVRIKELRKTAEDESVMNVLERKQRLTEIARAKVNDYVTEHGIVLDKSSPNPGAVSGLKSKVVYYKKGREPEVITDINMHNPITAIAELNKMDGIYETGTNVNLNFTWATLHQLAKDNNVD